MDAIFKALADPCRRRLLDRLNRRNGQSLQELCAGLDMARQSVTKHLAVLEAAELVTTVRRGREKLHYLNTAPINDIAERWIDRYNRQRAKTLADLKRALEDRALEGRALQSTTAAQTEFYYVTYIRTTPEELWQALTDPAFTFRYWGAGLRSDWKVGSPVRWQSAPGADFDDLDQVVIESEPYRRLSYTWHTYQPAHAEFFGWTDEVLAELRKEKRSKVTFTIEPAGSAVKLTVVHDDFEPDSEMLKAVSGRKPETGGWPEILANLKTLLETGAPLPPLTSSAASPG
jgi:uncharacterized protein YndB with AHSA1/START domain/DNA-binding transcriptional ArsR family regulator